MDSHEIAAKFDDRAGYELVSYAEVAMPFFRISASALIQGALTFSPIEEFTLRSLEIGLAHSDEISQFLGLDTQVIDDVAANLIQNTLVREKIDGTLQLTPIGRRDIAAQRPLRPTTETIFFDVDGLTRAAHWHRGYLHTPKDIKELGLIEIRAIPVRKPMLEEIEVEDVDRAIQISLGRESEKRVLRLREMFRAKRFFYDAIALIFRGKNIDEVQVAFAIDGRLSQAHEFAFAKGGGLKKSGIAKSILTSLDDREKVHFCGADFVNLVKKAERRDEDANKEVRKNLAIGKLKVEAKLKALNAQLSVDKQKIEQENYVKLLEENRVLREKIDTFPVRNIPVYEHPAVLDEALINSSKRVLIVSPWITPAVVNDVFIQKLRALLNRGVNLTIGYGIEDNPQFDRLRQTNNGERELQKLANNYNNFAFSKLGDTHAKILIKDSDFYVVTSFNWLSFRGDPKRKFREEWGTKVSISENVDEFYSKIIARFPKKDAV